MIISHITNHLKLQKKKKKKDMEKIYLFLKNFYWGIVAS